MQELLVDAQNGKKEILLVENGKLMERYVDEQGKERLEGNIYLGVVENVLPGMQAAFVNIGKEKNTFIHIRDIIPKVSLETGNKNEDFTNYNINNYLKTGMPILVQVKKDSTNKKGARISAHLSIPGRFIVLIPEEKFITISQKIDAQEERERLKKILKENMKNGYGAIIRTSAEGQSEENILADLKNVIEQYEEIQKEYKKRKEAEKLGPALIYKSEDITQRVITDLMDKDLGIVRTNDEEVYDEIKAKLKKYGKDIKVELQQDILNMYDLRKQLEDIENRKVWLKCGGFITIDKTEALTAIDVNSGKYTGKKDLENTIFTVNKEATVEIARQLKLRDIGGIIIIDYIDMQNKENEKKIIELFEENLKKDRSKTQIVGFSKLNLLEMTRKHMCSND